MMKRLLRFLSGVMSISSAVLGLLLFYRIRSQAGRVLFVAKATASAVTPFTLVLGALGAGLGLLLRSPAALLSGLLGAWISKRYIHQVTAPHDKFREAFGPIWQGQVPVHLWPKMLWSRWQWQAPIKPEPRSELDVTYWVLPHSGRPLFCDVWYPSDDVERSGLGVIYLHGSGWQLLNKDVGTRAFFKHMTAQGHVVMDVAYRLAPEADFPDMVGDVKRAVAWMKVNAERLEIDPQHIVLMGGSAGAHLALLAAYTPGHPEMTPEDVHNVDTTVKGVASFYGPTDLMALYEHIAPIFPDPRQARADRDRRSTLLYKLVAAAVRLNLKLVMPDLYQWSREHGPARLSDDDTLLKMLGGTPSEAPQNYQRYSPITYAGPGSPPTLLFQGEHDYLVPTGSALALVDKLRHNGVPALAIVFPQTGHAFDLVLPAISPVAQSALYDLDRFLGIMAGDIS
jgi:acetyl esterase/lipase